MRRIRGAWTRLLSRGFFQAQKPSSQPPSGVSLDLPRLLLAAVKTQAELLKKARRLTLKSRLIVAQTARLLVTKLSELRILLQPCLHLLLVHHHPLFLAASHLIRFFKVLLYLRYLFDWLPQVNPHLPPFTFVYRATDTYISIFTRIVPSIASMDLSGFAAWAVLEMTENYLARLIATLE
ncbi:putative YGGT family domain protein [Neospora caninum Liverpool]|uniref:Putative YGGT family domain protein n=1 Tax=Neospora caninum (strain Liverpool) TaxID=572307 RepID=F0VD14_NEOCL|nr:putative YGGT family domain protein [Neospora caninum Liverpool]CBZ51529.1 putative YGGT family domain protein [Neospora caninum Liverpool]CEL65479.1 TPA: YGGT family domain protein, putative [Neospora caninum Liverpool]|eukprot:XP_003881562.1 putative YGGT family domain protein [Neospora caninum Liverpool]